MDFEMWMIMVDNCIVASIGLSRDDIPDWCYWDAWNEGQDAHEAAQAAMEEGGVYYA